MNDAEMYLLLQEMTEEGTQMLNVNYADDARQLSDGELSAVLKTYQDEQQRRAAVPEHLRPDPKISKMLQERHSALYGANPRAVEIAEQHHKRHFG